jgi:Na+/pantothenate symporter
MSREQIISYLFFIFDINISKQQQKTNKINLKLFQKYFLKEKSMVQPHF